MSDISVSMLTPLTAETFVFRLVCSACSVVRLLAVAALCCCLGRHQVGRVVRQRAAGANGAVRFPEAPRPLVFRRRLGDSSLRLGAEGVVEDVGDQRGEAGRPARRVGRECGGAGGASGNGDVAVAHQGRVRGDGGIT